LEELAMMAGRDAMDAHADYLVANGRIPLPRELYCVGMNAIKDFLARRMAEDACRTVLETHDLNSEPLHECV